MREWEQLGPYRLHLSEAVFPLTGDTLALGAFATVRDRDTVCDLGCGSGALLLLAARRAAELTLLGLDVDGRAVALTEENLRNNGLNGRTALADVSRPEGPPWPAACELVLCNPPYFASGTGRSGGGGRMETAGTLDAFLHAGARLLKPGGKLALCHRVQRMTDVLLALRQNGLEPKRMKLTPPLLLVEAVKDARPGGLILEE